MPSSRHTSWRIALAPPSPLPYSFTAVDSGVSSLDESNPMLVIVALLGQTLHLLHHALQRRLEHGHPVNVADQQRKRVSYRNPHQEIVTHGPSTFFAPYSAATFNSHSTNGMRIASAPAIPDRHNSSFFTRPFVFSTNSSMRPRLFVVSEKSRRRCISVSAIRKSSSCIRSLVVGSSATVSRSSKPTEVMAPSLFDCGQHNRTVP